MANQNGTGPQGMGPMTGRGMGPCGAGNARGMGRGMGRGMRCRYSNTSIYSKDDQKKLLTEDAKYLEEELKAIKERLEDLK